MSYPKVVALDTDWTIWKEFLDHKKWGKGRNAYKKVEDNIERPANDNKLLRDRSNHKNSIRVYDDISGIVNDIIKNGSKLAIVSRNPSKAMCDRALYYFNTINPNDKKEWSIIHLVKYDEVINETKVNPFKRIIGWYKGDFKSNVDYSDMLLFDDEALNNEVRIVLGVTFQFVRDGKGLTWDSYRRGLEAWQRAKNLMVGSPTMPRTRKRIGYSGLPPAWIKLVHDGEGVVDPKTPYRWGYALYITDIFGIAKFFCQWNKNYLAGKSSVCEVWVKDYDAWVAMNKVWVPENGVVPQMNNMTWTLEASGRNQENRDRLIADRWKVYTPYVLFSRHHHMHSMPNYALPRFNEMVIYTQVQRSLFEIVTLDDSQVNQTDVRHTPFPFHKQRKAWNITIPNETIKALKPAEANLFQ